MTQARTVRFSLVLVLGVAGLWSVRHANAQSEIPAQPAQRQQLTQGALLAGTLGDARWALFAPGHDESGVLSGTLFLTAPPDARVTGVKYQPQDKAAVLAYRSSATLRDVLDVHDQQLKRQGFEPQERALQRGRGRITYQRGESQIELRVSGSEGSYRVQLVMIKLRSPGARR